MMSLSDMMAIAFASARRRVLRLRIPLLMLLCVASLALFLWTGVRLTQTVRDNAAVRAIAAGADVSVDPKRAGAEVIVARARRLLDQDRIEDAQTLLDAAGPLMPPSAHSRMLYNHGNWRTRAAMNAVERGDFNKALPLVKLAKDDYRHALTLDPGAWDAKLNLDVASRLVRDMPGYGQEGDEASPDAKTRLWTDLPGVPRGLP